MQNAEFLAPLGMDNADEFPVAMVAKAIVSCAQKDKFTSIQGPSNPE
jgi:hypothetical protein